MQRSLSSLPKLKMCMKNRPALNGQTEFPYYKPRQNYQTYKTTSLYSAKPQTPEAMHFFALPKRFVSKSKFFLKGWREFCCLYLIHFDVLLCECEKTIITEQAVNPYLDHFWESQSLFPFTNHGRQKKKTYFVVIFHCESSDILNFERVNWKKSRREDAEWCFRQP